jgi:hypothetical protein
VFRCCGELIIDTVGSRGNTFAERDDSCRVIRVRVPVSRGDFGNRSGSGRNALRNSCSNNLVNINVGFPAMSHDHSNPVSETAGWTKWLFQIGKFEMCVSVDQPRNDSRVSQIESRRMVGRMDRGDQSVVEFNGRVSDGVSVTGKNPSRLDRSLLVGRHTRQCGAVDVKRSSPLLLDSDRCEFC